MASVVVIKPKWSPFIPVDHVVKGQDDFEEDYINYKIKDIVVKTGDGEEDFVIKQKVIVEKTPIKEVIARDAGTTGIRALMERVVLTGDESLYPQPMPADGVISDYTNCPEDLMAADHMASAAVSAYDALPDEIKKGRSFSDFCNSFTNEEYAQWVASLTAQLSADKDKGGDE